VVREWLEKRVVLEPPVEQVEPVQQERPEKRVPRELLVRRVQVQPELRVKPVQLEQRVQVQQVRAQQRLVQPVPRERALRRQV
jgi:hypothetical protein